MTIKEAIEILKSRRICAAYVDSEYVDSVDIEAINMAISALEKRDELAADVVEVRHGRWIDSEEDGHLSICGVCNYPVDRFYKTKYCPNCGAKMTEDHREQKE